MDDMEILRAKLLAYTNLKPDAIEKVLKLYEG